jgi:carbon-monoxide dehydrogenase catalytic subunit
MLVTALADHLKVDIPDLPIAVTAPEWMEQKATIDALFAIAYGAYTHLSPTPFITGAPALVRGKVALGDDPVEAAKDIKAHILKKRKMMGLKE